MESNTPTPGSDDRKRAYAKPEFRMYGRLAEITASVGNTGKSDGGKGSMNNTGA